MKKLIWLLLIIAVNRVCGQNNQALHNLAVAKEQQVALERSSGNLNINTVNALPEQDLAGAIPVCQNVYTVGTSYSGAGAVLEITAGSTCLNSGEKNSVWYSFTCHSAGRLKYTITPNNLPDDYDYILYDITGYTYSDIQNDVVVPLVCNFSAAGGKTGLDSIGTNANESATGPRFNPLLNLIPGHTYMLNLSNFTGSTFGYKLDFTGTTANIGGTLSSIQNVIPYCGTDSLTVHLSSTVLNTSIAGDGSDFTFTNSTGTYSVISAVGTSANGFSNKIVLKLNGSISSAGTFSLGLVNGSDGNTLLKSCNNIAVSVGTFTFNAGFIAPSPAIICQNSAYTLSALPANSYTWTGTQVQPSEINNQSLSILTNTSGVFTFTLETTSSCGVNANTFSLTINPAPSLSISPASASVCPGATLNLVGTGATNYYWSVINPSYEAFTPFNFTSSVFRVSPTQNNVYRLSGSNTNGCSSVAFYTVSVFANPLVSITGIDTVCHNTSALLSSSGTATSYTWGTSSYSLTTVIATNATSISITPTVSANYYVTGIDGSTGCKSTSNKYITVIGTETVSTTKSYLCMGDSAILTVLGTSSYTWNTGVVNNSITVIPNVSTTYTVQYENIPVCGVRTSTVSIPVFIVPTVSVSPPVNAICYGGTATFSVTSSPSGYVSSYNWSNGYMGPTTNVWTQQSPLGFTNTISASGVSYPGACPVFASTSYTVHPLPKIITSLSTGICGGDTSWLSVTSGVSSYTWNPGNTINSGIVVSPSVTTNYTVAGTDLIGCKSTQIVTVAKSTNSLNIVANPSVVCVGGTSTLTASGNGLIKWYASDTASHFLATGLSFVTPTLSIGTYTYYVSSTCTGDTFRKPVIITVNGKPIINVAAASNTVCVNSQFQIIASGANSYTWTSNPSSINIVNDTLTQIKLSIFPVSYFVTGKDIYGCVGTNSMVINVFPLLQNTVTATPNYVCPGSPSVLSLTGASSYTWSTGVVSTTAVVNPMMLTTYTVSFPTPFGCIQENYVNVNNYSSSPYINAPSTTTLCSGTTVTLSANSATTYTWSTGQTGSSVVVTPTIGASPGTVTYTVSSTNGAGCTGSSTKTFTVFPIPNVNIVANRDTICLGSALTMTATGAISYTWSNNSTSTTYNAGTISVPTTYSVTGKNSYGCKATYIKNIGIFSVIQATAVVSPTTMVCFGQPVSISAVGVSNYSVSGYGGPYNTPKTVYPSPSTSIYNIYTNDVNGCPGTCSISVTSDGSALFGISSPFNVCSDSRLDMSVSNSTLTYVWNPTVTPLSNVSYSTTSSANLIPVTYTVTGNNAMCSSTRTVSTPIIQSPVVSVVVNNTITCATPTVQIFATISGAVTIQWSRFSNNTFYIQSSVSPTVNVTIPGIYYCKVTSTINGCTATATCVVSGDFTNKITLTPSFTVCGESAALLSAGGSTLYTWGTGGVWGGFGPMGSNSSSISVTPTATTIYSVSGVGSNGCAGSATTQVNVIPGPAISFAPTSVVCIGSSVIITANGADLYNWSTGANTPSVQVLPTASQVYTVTGTNLATNCSSTRTINIAVVTTCQNVWPGDANSDGIADNLDILELGLHYTQTGPSRTSVNNNWQASFANNWAGTISNGKNKNHSDCNGDGIINDNDTLAIFSNYNLTHAFKPIGQATTVRELSIIPDQNFVVAGSWGSSSIYLGESVSPVNDVNGVAFTVNFDNTLLEPNSVWIEYPASFINAGDQNLDFKKLDFTGNNLYTATTHTINNNVSGNGLIAVLHYRILTTLSTDQVLNLGLVQGNKSDAAGSIAPLTVGTGTLMAIGASVGMDQTFIKNNTILISPNPTSGILNISLNSDPQNTNIEIYSSLGALVLSEAISSKINTISTSALSSGIYFIKMFEGDKLIAVRKIVKE